MRLAHLRQALANLPAHLSDWTETTVDSVLWDGVVIVVESNTDEVEALREQVKENEQIAEKAGKEEERERERADALEKECEELREEMAALKDPSKDGESVATYRQRALDAEADAEKAREHAKEADRRMEEMAKELAAMRKRKGVEPGLMAHTWEVTGFLNTVAHYGSADQLRRDDHTAATLARLGSDAKRLAEKINATATAGTAKRAA